MMKRLLAAAFLALALTGPALAYNENGATIDPRASPFNAKCDGVTQDQTAMQAALNSAMASGSTLLIPGRCVISGLTINSPVVISGNGDRSQLVLASGSTAPAISISIGSGATGVLNDFTDVTLQNMVITSPDRGDANRALEHGITATNGSPAVNLVVNLINMTIFGIPGDGLHLTAFTGYFKLVNTKILLPGINGFNCNSSTDTVIDGGEFYGAIEYNWVISNCTNTKISNSNEFTALKTGVLVYHSSDVVFNNDTIDTAAWNALEIDNLVNQTVTVIGGFIRWSGVAANNTYYDVLSGLDNAGITTLYSVHFSTPASSYSPNKPAGNIGFYNASSAPINCFNCVFDLGPIGTAGISNAATGQLYSGTKQPFTIDSNTQYTGISGFNGTNFPWSLFCSSVICDDGALVLSNGGVAGVTLLGFGQSTIPSLTLSGIPTSAGAGGLYVCIDTAGVTYKKASCP